MDKMMKALMQVLDLSFKTYTVSAVIPYDEDGGTRNVKVRNIPAVHPSQAVQYASEVLNIPDIDPDEFEVGSREYLSADMYGIVNVRRDLDEEIITKKDLINSWKDIFKRYYTIQEGKRMIDNKEEVVGYLKKKYKVGKNAYI